jgi:monovalent cation:H+ antiporter-2, CPA2 family
MSLEISAITDLAVIMIVASIVALIFHKLKQPMVVGYLIAGIIVGPYSPPISLITHIDVLDIFAQIGVILLLFTIGFEFPLQKLRSIGRVIIGVSAIEITLMLLVSWGVGAYLLKWSFYDTVFLGVALASSSTTIIAKVLSEMGKIKEISATIMLGILVVEDIVVVILLAMLQNLAVTKELSLASTSFLVLKLVVFIGGTLTVGYFLLPKAIDKIANMTNREYNDEHNHELLYIVMLGLCFGLAILANQIGFSVAIGAFLAGVVAARSHFREEINKEIDPLQHVFGAIFFVSMGALMDISKIAVYWVPALIVILALLGTKLFSCGVGTRLFGYNSKTSLRVGLGMAQIGEFAFIVIKVGQDAGVISDFLLPIIGVAAIITSFLTPYLIKFSFRQEKNLKKTIKQTVKIERPSLQP